MDKYITKFDYAHTRGFQVRVPTVTDGVLMPYDNQVTNKFFKKGDGAWIAAFDIAMLWRDTYMTENNIEYLLTMARDKQHPMTSSSRNTSGVIGVALQVNYKAADMYYGYKATWCVDKRQYTRQFSTNLYGECDAFLMACRLRFRHAGILIITDIKAVPCLPDVEYTIKATK
jgi:hypothetical protein